MNKVFFDDPYMNAAVITIGKEILIGQITDTNAAFIGQKLTETGLEVVRMISVADSVESIQSALKEASEHADIVISTGGLGPTSDDVTKQVLCRYFQTSLILHQPTLEHIRQLFAARNMQMNELNAAQAMLPASAQVLFNSYGTAPGLWFEKEGKNFIFLPGVPFEMKAILLDSVLPELKKRFFLSFILHRTIMTQGLPESYMAQRLQDFEKQLPPGFSLAYLPSYGGVRLRISASGKKRQELEHLVDTQVQLVLNTIRPFVYGYDEETLPEAIGKILREKKMFLAVAESCTGGSISAAITSVPGSSEYFKGGIVAYSNEIKEMELSVPEHLIQKFGAVSREVVVSMTRGIMKKFGTDLAIAVTGIAGPGGGTPDKPVGTVWIAVGSEENIIARLFRFGENRERNIYRTTQTALNMLRMFVQGFDIDSVFKGLP
ncbi:MAG TPA: competence/damage-inducible protein A [Bacteroidales bacterium]|nr:competence/damage-inducible protein A [Bacteroidales bacterium]